MAGRQLCKISGKAKVSGVCAGLSEFLGVDVSLIRIVWLIAIFMGFGSPVIIYIVMAIVLPEYDPDSVDFKDYDDDDHNDQERY